MADFGKGKERQREGGPATPAVDSLTAGDGSTGVESETAAPALPSTNPSASAGAPQDSERAPAASTNSTELPSETVQGPAPTAQLVNPLILVVSIPGLFLQPDYFLEIQAPQSTPCHLALHRASSNVSRIVQMTQTRLWATMMPLVTQHPSHRLSTKDASKTDADTISIVRAKTIIGVPTTRFRTTSLILHTTCSSFCLTRNYI